MRSLLADAQARNLPVALAGTRHSMGGQTIAPAGVVVNMLPYRPMELDETRGVLRVGTGARWADVVPFLDARGLVRGRHAVQQ